MYVYSRQETRALKGAKLLLNTHLKTFLLAQPRVRLRDFKRSISNATQITQPFMRLSPYHNLLPCIASFKGERSVLQHQFDKTLSRPNIEIHFKDDKYAKIIWKNFFGI